MILIIGLGNPGDKYVATRHNMGFLALDQLAEDIGEGWSVNSEMKAEVIETNIDGTKVILAKPQTFMNKSGEAVQALAAKYKIDTNNVWIVYDEASMDFGKLRVRLEGSAGGHNGIKSIIQHLGTETFGRVRIGIGEAPEKMDLEDWVLSKYSASEVLVLETLLQKVSQTLEDAIQKGSLESFTENLSE